MKYKHWRRVAPVVIAIGGAGGALALSVGGLGLKYEQEWVRTLLQVGLVGVLGLVISMVLERFKDTLQRRRDVSRLRFNALAELSRTYLDVKLVRRTLQASNTFTETETGELNKLQAEIELHKRVSVSLFRQRVDLQNSLETMEEYLNHVANDPSSQEHTHFLSKEGFRVFADAYGGVIARIRDEIATG